MRKITCAALVLGAAFTCAFPSAARAFSFSTGNPDGKIATASRPESSGKVEIESADDFVLSGPTRITNASFTGLLTGNAGLGDIGEVVVEIYRVFPKDSNNPPSGRVPTRVNSPSDVAFDSREKSSGDFSLTTTVLNNSFTAANSVVNRINPIPNQTTGGEGPVTGKEVRFDVAFSHPFSLPTDHYFFVPQVEVNAGEFLWLSAPKPIVAPGTPFTPDLQSWTRNQNLQPDWLRIGTDIVDGSPPTTFNASFSVNGEAVPEPTTLGGAAIAGIALLKLRHKRSKKKLNLKDSMS